MVTFRNNNNRRNNFRRNDRNFKSNGDRPKYGSNFSNNDNFQRKIPGRNNHNASKLIEKYNNLATEALSSDDTDGYGAQILESDRWTQFVDMESTDLLDADTIDGISGATFTTNAWKAALTEISIFHQAEFEGNIVYTIEELDAIYQEQLSVDGATIVDVTEQKIPNLM